MLLTVSLQALTFTLPDVTQALQVELTVSIPLATGRGDAIATSPAFAPVTAMVPLEHEELAITPKVMELVAERCFRIAVPVPMANEPVVEALPGKSTVWPLLPMAMLVALEVPMAMVPELSIFTTLRVLDTVTV